jgi:hypothetical protein
MEDQAYVPEYNAEYRDREGAIADFEQEIKRLTSYIDSLESRLSPVLSQYATANEARAVPEEEPANQFRKQIRHLGALSSRLAGLTERIDL